MITLFTADTRQNRKNCRYPHRIAVTDAESLKKAVSRDYTCAQFKGCRRSVENFLRSDCVGFDVDNDFSDIPAEWILPRDIAEFFSGTTFWVHYSRSNMRSKNGKEARPKFHVLFPIRPCDDAEAYAALKQTVQKIFPYFDAQALDAARFFFGTEDPETEYWEGVRDLTEFLERRGVNSARGACTAGAREGTCCVAPGTLSELNKSDRAERYKCESTQGWHSNAGALSELSIPLGQRNNAMHRFAVKALKRYGN